MKKQIIIALVLSLTAMTTFAAGFGVSHAVVSADTSQSQAIQRLLGSENANLARKIGSSAVTPVTVARPQAAAIAAASKMNKSEAKSKNNIFGATGVGREAFSTMVRHMMPLSPNQIKTLRYMFDKSQRAAASYPGIPPRPTSSSVIVNLSPGAVPPVIRLRAGFVTSLVFLDSTGKPWPIKAYDLGDPKSFNIQWNQKGNTLLVQALDSYKSGNLAVMLKGHDTPVMVSLIPGQRAVDYRVDLRIPGLGPNAAPMQASLPGKASAKLLSFLDGVPPQGSKTLQVEGGECQAWLLDGHMFLRTRLTVLSPSWLSTMSSPDGTHVYEITKAPVVLASMRGEVVHLMIQGL